MSRGLRKPLLGVAKTLGLTLVFVVATGVGSYLHVDLPPARRVVARNVEALLGDTFQGRFEIESIDRISSRTLRVSRVRVRDPEGVVVLDVRGLRVRADAFDLLAEALSDSSQRRLAFQHVRAERADVTIRPDPASGVPTIGTAFALSPKMKKKPASTTPSPLRVWFPTIELGEGSVRGRLAGTPSAEGHVKGVRGSVLVSPVGVAVDAPQFSALLRVAGSPEVRGVAAFHQRGTTHFYGTFDGYVGELQVNSVGRLDGKRLDVKLDLPNAEPGLVRALFPDWPVRETVVAHAELAGDIPDFRANGHFVVGSSIVDATGDVRMGSEASARLAVTGQKVDLRAVLADSPPTSIDTQGEIVVRETNDGVTLEFSGKTEATAIENVPIPAADFTGRFAKKLLEARGTLHEPGMPVEATFALTTEGVIDIDARAKRFRVEKAPRAHGIVPADGAADLHAKLHIEKGRIDADVDAELESFAYGPLRVGSGKVTGSVAGPLARPAALALDLRGKGRQVRAGEFSFDEVEAKVKGPLERLELSTTLAAPQGAKLTATTKLRAVGATRFDDVELLVERGEAKIHARAANVELGAGSVEARDVRVEGAGGTLTGSTRYRPGLFELEAHGKGVDLGAVSRVLGLSKGALDGAIDLDAEVVAAKDVRKGDLRVTLTNGSFGPVTGISLDVDTSLNDDALTGEAATQVSGYGRARASWELELAGDLLERESWRRAGGRFDAGVESFDLAHLEKFLPPELGVREVRGLAVGQVSILRAEAGVLPNVDAFVQTNGLGVTLERERAQGEPVEIAGIEAGVRLGVDGKTGATDATLRLVDDYGLLLSSTGHVELDLEKVLARPSELVKDLQKKPILLAALVENRAIQNLPELVRPKGVSGTLRAEANLRGTLASPVLSLKAALGAVTLGDDVQSRPFDACLRAQYDPAASRFGFGSELYIDDPTLVPCAGRRVAIANAAGDLDLAAARSGKRAFRGDAQLSLEDLPLEFVTPLARARISGRARGRAALVQADDAPQLSAKIMVSEATVRDLELGEGTLEVRSNGPDLRADVKLVKRDGSLAGEGRVGLDWEGLVPGLDRSRPLGATAEVHNVDAAVLQPVLEDIVSDLTGRLDGSVRVALVPERSPDGATTWTGDVSGKASLEDGSLQLAGLGMRLSALRFDAEAKKIGRRTVVTVRKLSAASRSKNPNVSASADLYLDGLDFEGGRANVNLQEVPLLIQGTPQATLTGRTQLTLERFPDRVHVLVNVPKLTAELPRSTGGSVLSLDAHPDIEILQPIAEPTLRTSGDGLPWVLEFQLGRDVVVRRADMNVPIGGAATVALSKDVEVAGDIDMEPGGRVTLIGKTFVVEQGEVHFDTGDPTNPHLRVLASWRAPDATIVYVEVRGTFREATLRLESDPARSEAEIQALLLGGGASESGDAQGAGVGYGADFVSELLADTNLPHVELRTGSETASDDRRYATYTAAVQISDEVWFEGSYKALSASEQTDDGDALTGTVDWRFRRDWSLRTELGNLGTGVDLLWQYRY